MQKILRRRMLRDLKDNFLRYLALGALIILGMYMIVSIVGAAEAIIVGTEQKGKDNQVEDGEFGVFVPLTAAEEEMLSDQGITLEKNFYMDFKVGEDSTLRVFTNRKKINLTAFDKGNPADTSDEIVLEKRYCEENNLQIGDSLMVGDITYRIAGTGSVPDYEAVFEKLSDNAANSQQFGVAFVTKEAYEMLKASGQSMEAEQYQYTYRLNGSISQEKLKEKLKDLELTVSSKKVREKNLTFFLKAEENSRIGAAGEDVVINKNAGLIAGVIIMILFTYVISVFVVHTIEKESSVIGALYALGVKKKDLTIHYLATPVAVTFFAAVAGTVLGFSKWGIPMQMADIYDYFSLPELTIIYPAYLLIYSLVMPIVVAIIVNMLVISRRLSAPVLALMRNEQKGGKTIHINLGKMGFIRRFQIRQMLREARTGITVIFGMFIALLIMMLGINCYVLCRHIGKDNKKDAKFEYMYTYKYPEKAVPKGGEACYLKTLKGERFGYNLDVSLMGIDDDNSYFNAKVKEGKNQIVASSAMAQKYGLHIGEQVILSDEDAEINYAFEVTDIVQYSVGLYAFMDINSMRELFSEEEDYYNVVLSDKELNIENERLYATTTKQDISNASDIFVSKMMPMIIMLCSASSIIFVVVMYLMLKVMLDRSTFNISLVKVFGYRMKEVKKLYLNGNFIIIAVGAVVCIPLSKVIMDWIYPVLISNVACGMNLQFTWQLYVGIYFIIIALYLIMNQFLVIKLKKVLPAEILKNRE